MANVGLLLFFSVLGIFECVVRKEHHHGQGSIIVDAAGDLQSGNTLRSRKTNRDTLIQSQTETHTQSASSNSPVQEDSCLSNNDGVVFTEQGQDNDRDWPQFCTNPLEESLDGLDPFVANFANTADFLRGVRGQDNLSKMKVWSCNSSHSLSEKVVQRIGPFQSVGNYSWHQFSLYPVANSLAFLRDHPAGFYVTQIASITVNSEGKVVDQPPLHIHHGDVVSGSTMWKHDFVSCVLGVREACYAQVDQLVGDQECTASTGGWSCLNFKMPSGFAFLFKHPIGMWFLVNDVRRSDSPLLEWYLQWYFSLVPSESGKLRQVSQLSFFHPGVWNEVGRKAHTGSAFNSRLDRETFVWHSMAMRFSGTLVQGRYHSHGMNIDEVLVFAAAPSALGLQAKQFSQKPVWEPIRPEDVKLQSNAQVKQYIWHNFYNATARSQIDSTTSPALKCRIKGQNEIISGFDVYRKANVCCRQWLFDKGDVVTQITFMIPRAVRFAHLPNDTITVYPQHSNVNLLIELNSAPLNQIESLEYAIFGNHYVKDALIFGGPYWHFGSEWHFGTLLYSYQNMFGNSAVPASRGLFLIELAQVSFVLIVVIAQKYWFYSILFSALLVYCCIWISRASQDKPKNYSQTNLQ